MNSPEPEFPGTVHVICFFYDGKIILHFPRWHGVVAAMLYIIFYFFAFREISFSFIFALSFALDRISSDGFKSRRKKSVELLKIVY